MMSNVGAEINKWEFYLSRANAENNVCCDDANDNDDIFDHGHEDVFYHGHEDGFYHGHEDGFYHGHEDGVFLVPCESFDIFPVIPIEFSAT